MIKNQYLLAWTIYEEAERKNDFWGMFIALAGMQLPLKFLGKAS